ncbi:hypothetical protein [Hungatella hathewayi]|uniref:hypothetical protein n=1 Tax=Hungatella hathewayi TaxID=154046 RepID=UPI003561A973
MKKFDVIRSITEVKEFSNIIYDMAKIAGSSEGLQQMLSEELTEEGLRTIQSVAHSGNYPLSFDGKQ